MEAEIEDGMLQMVAEDRVEVRACFLNGYYSQRPHLSIEIRRPSRQEPRHSLRSAGLLPR